MLYDPKWTRELTVLGFVNWLKTQDPGTHYDYVNPRDCIICRYMKSVLGFKRPAISPIYGYGEEGEARKPYDSVLDKIACGDKDTYGAALKRAEALLEMEKENVV